MRRECCWNCKFWETNSPWLDDRRDESSEPGEYQHEGYCRRRAPVVPPSGLAKWPRTYQSEYCGDHEPMKAGEP